MRKPLQFAELEWSTNNQPRSRQFDDIYFYNDDKLQQDGLQESQFVFLHNNHLRQRWQSLKKTYSTRSQPFVIAETGFGTGLNFLAAWQLWDEVQVDNASLHFISVEKYPLRPLDLARALSAWPQLQPYCKQLLTYYPSLLAEDFYSLHIAGTKVTLTLIIADVVDGLRQCLQSDHPHFQLPFGRGVDAWFLDGFAPRLNPDMWSATTMKLMAQLSHAATTFATFTAAGSVQRNLRAQGFTVEKIPGFAGKREMLRGYFLPPASSVRPVLEKYGKYPIPWSVIPATLHNKTNTITIIGAGLAGCHTARALAERGWRVLVVDAADAIAAGASGNAQGIVYAKLSADDDALAQFNLSALLVAAHTYQPWWQRHSDLGQGCGVLQLAHNDKELHLLHQCQHYFSTVAPEQNNCPVQFVDANHASKLAGIDCQFPGMFFSGLGWANPVSLCHRLLDHPNISLHLGIDVFAIDYLDSEGVWSLHSRTKQAPILCEHLVIANAFAANQFAQTQTLPLKKIRGQLTYLENDRCINAVKTVICGESYLAPVDNHSGMQTLGATFDLQDMAAHTRPEDHRRNLAGIAKGLPQLQSTLATVDTNAVNGRAHFRCTTPDYLPLVGPVHQHDYFVETYAKLRVNANSVCHMPGRVWPNLYLNVGHGSRGLAYAPLCAQLLAAIINGEPLPVSRTLLQALHPGRFTLRGLIRRQF